ncbi:autotransporter outer membrane beta-barrel domain-containing protein [Enterobacteriaceae bacterium BIT-l23]|uniref:autotransporter outer membrane beta-barrel domain-containing protein n=1 Tax=Jejubacter sp. L23 TaxID=3092086 RepID=UPI001584CB25|nr:autotransporter outer membrane beta-barrel domain-containing protein [Enterobacteriaceae bacterium BIT-l23]
MTYKRSVMALLVSAALYPAVQSAQAATPVSLPLGHLEERLTITVGVNGGPAQKYIFDTGSDQFNAVLSQGNASQMPQLDQAQAYIYGDDAWGGYWLQHKRASTLTYYTADENPTAVSTPDSGGHGYVIGHVEHLLLDGKHGGRISKDPIIVPGFQKPFYIDLDAQERIDSGQPTEEQNEEKKNFYGTFGVGDFLFEGSGGSPFATVTKSGFVVAGNDSTPDNDDTSTLSPGCAPCTILNLSPAVRAQFTTQVPWAAHYDEGDRQTFPGSGAPASTQHEGQFKYTFVLDVNGQQKTIEVPGEALKGAVLLDTGNPTHVTIESAKLGSVLQQNGLKIITKGDETSSNLVSMTLHPTDSSGNPVGEGILLQDPTGNLVIDSDGSDEKTWNITMGLGFFLQYSVMYDLENRLTAFTPFFVSADNFTTDGQLSQITAEMGNPMKAPKGDPSGQQATKGYLGLAGAISGTGDLTLAPNIVVNMTGANTYTGATRVQKDAVLFLSGPGSIAASSELVNNGWFDISTHGNANPLWGVSDSLNDVTLQSLSGSGLITLGSRNLVLNNAHGDFSGRITDQNLRSGGVDHEKGGLTIAGGSQTLSGNSDYTGQTRIASGAALQLASNGTLTSDVIAEGAFVANGATSGHVEIQSGGLAGGNGRVGSLTAAQGSTVAPGNSIGTLNVDGDMTLAQGSLYAAEVDASGSDQIKVAGTATVQGADVTVIPYARNNLLAQSTTADNLIGSTGTLLTAGGGVSGQFASVESGPFITPSLTYQPDSVAVTLARSDLSFADVAATRNQRSMAAALDQLPASSSVYQSLLLAPTEGDARQAMRQLSGQIHADIASSLVNNSRYLRDTLNSRLRQAQGQIDSSDIRQNEDGAWASLMGNWQHASGNNNASGFHDSTFGVLLGVDGDVADGWRVGAATGFTRTSLHGNHASADSDNYHLALYTGKSWDNVNLRAGTAYTWHRIETDRSVNYYGQSDSDKARYSAGTGQIFAEAGYSLNNDWLNLEPFANLAWVDYRSNRINERGGASALSADSQHTSAALSTLGLRADKRWQTGKESAITLRGELGWLHQYNSPEREVGLRFQGAGTTFNTGTVPASRDGMVMKTGAEVSINDTASVSLNYTGMYSDNYQDNGLSADLKWTF